MRFRQAQHRAIGQAHGKIMRALPHRIGKPRTAARAQAQRGLHFRPAGMVFHLRAIGFAVVQHAAVRRDPGRARARRKSIEKRLRIRGLLHALRGDAGFPLHRVVQFIGDRVIKRPQQNPAGKQHRRQRDGHHAPEYCPFHVLSPSMR